MCPSNLVVGFEGGSHSAIPVDNGQLSIERAIVLDVDVANPIFLNLKRTLERDRLAEDGFRNCRLVETGCGSKES